jgi:hypothetical protein
MSLTITDANGVNLLLRALLRPDADPRMIQSGEAAALGLTARARQTLSAGLTPDDVLALWADHATRRTALDLFLRMVADPDLMTELGPRLSCVEADAFVTLLAVYGKRLAANALYDAHAASDDVGDAHGKGAEG